MITVEHLSKNFVKIIKEPGVMGSIKSLFKQEKKVIPAVKNINFSMKEGEILGLIGPNGAGKSTLIKMLTGILKPTEGLCTIDGFIPQKDRQKYVKEIGVVFGQRTQLWWDLPLEESFTVLKEIYEVTDKEFIERMDYLDNILELKSFIKSPVRTLSLGQRMRADIAATLLHNPKVLFLDEPTIGLDATVKKKIREAIKEINEKYHTTIILTTHDLADIEELCTRVMIVDKGTIIYDGSLENLKKDFGRRYEITFELTDKSNASNLRYFERFNTSEDQFKIKQLHNVINVSFDAEEFNIQEVIQYTLECVKINDIKVNDADIEEVVRMVYKEGIMRG